VLIKKKKLKSAHFLVEMNHVEAEDQPQVLGNNVQVFGVDDD
jgi:hypothetical protein